MRIVVFGYSTTYGCWDYEHEGWVNRLRRFLDKKISSRVYNLGISGDTTIELLERFERECKPRIKEGLEELSVIIIAIGINDSQFLNDKKINRVPEEEFELNIRKLIEISKNFKSKTLFVGLTPVDESKTMPVPWDKNKSYKNEYIHKYDGIIKSLCKENKIPFVEVFEKMLNLNYEKLLEDGLHPNSKGHMFIFEAVKDFLIDNEIINVD